jgi:hypothetical protein
VFHGARLHADGRNPLWSHVLAEVDAVCIRAASSGPAGWPTCGACSV